jgi:hypothetical protein
MCPLGPLVHIQGRSALAAMAEHEAKRDPPNLDVDRDGDEECGKALAHAGYRLSEWKAL